jgi:hypothetical protein
VGGLLPPGRTFHRGRARGPSAAGELQTHTRAAPPPHAPLPLPSCLRPAPPLALQDVALDYIGKRGSIIGATREKRIQYARDLLQKELLPHVAVGPHCETKKVRDEGRAAAGTGWRYA